MGLHFHAHKVRTYKEQGKEEQANAQASVNPLDKLIADVEKHVLNVEAGVPMKEAKQRLDREARQFIAALRAYKELLNKPINTPNAHAPKAAVEEKKPEAPKPVRP